MGKTFKATVAVAKREGGHNGWFHAGKHWHEGTHEVELTEGVAHGLAQRPGVTIIVDGKVMKADDFAAPVPTAPTSTAGLTPDEANALASYREAKKRDASIAEQYTPKETTPETAKPPEDPAPVQPSQPSHQPQVSQHHGGQPGKQQHHDNKRK